MNLSRCVCPPLAPEVECQHAEPLCGTGRDCRHAEPLPGCRHLTLHNAAFEGRRWNRTIDGPGKVVEIDVHVACGWADSRASDRGAGMDLQQLFNSLIGQF